MSEGHSIGGEIDKGASIDKDVVPDIDLGGKVVGEEEDAGCYDGGSPRIAGEEGKAGA